MTSPAPRTNIELKARVHDPARIRALAESIATARLGVQRQIDTYFHCRAGRLKLRQIEGGPSQLVAYARADTTAAKASDYHLLDVPDGEALRVALDAALGTWKVVDKRREIWLVDNVRIHLDEVVGLGWFLEFEAVLGPTINAARGQEQLAQLSARFGLVDSDRLAGSYSDMLG